MDPPTRGESLCRTRVAIQSDAEYILDLATRVQSALTASGSLQELTPSTLDTIKASIHNGEILIFSSFENVTHNNPTRIGSVTISPFSPSSGHGSASWKVEGGREKTWYLHSLMLEPPLQGKGLGRLFLRDVLGDLGERYGDGIVVLDCWAGNGKLRTFYEEVGFSLVGVFPEEGYEIAVFKIGMRA